MITLYTNLPGSVDVTVDGAPAAVAEAGLSVDLTWGASHTFGAAAVLPLESGTRQLFSKWEVYNWNGAKREYSTNPLALAASDYGFTVKAIYVKQFYFDVVSPYGAVQNRGWYNEDSLVRAVVSGSPVNTSDTTRYYFWYWGDNPDDDAALSNPAKVTGPISLEAHWRPYFQLITNVSFDPFLKTTEFYPRGEVRRIEAKDYPGYFFQQWVYANENLPPIPYRVANVIMDGPHSLLALYTTWP